MTTKKAIPTVAVLTVPFDRGATRRGAAQGPEAIFNAGFERKLQDLELDYTVAGISAAISGNPALVSEEVLPEKKLKNLTEVIAVNEALAAEVSGAVQEHKFPLVIGGDHSIAIGTLAGLTQHYHNLGVIWIDAHSDLNTPVTSPSGNIHGMSLAVALGIGDERLTAIGGTQRANLSPRNVVIIGARSLDRGERELIKREGVTCFTMQDIDRRGMFSIIEDAIRIASHGTDGVHLSFDIDSVEPKEAPGTGTPIQGGLSYREAHLACEVLAEAGVVTSAEFVENNPLLDKQQMTSNLVVGLIGSLLGERII